MPDSPQWQIQTSEPPDWCVQVVQRVAPTVQANIVASLLWQRGIRDPATIPGFLNPDLYTPASPFEFGIEMERAVERLQQARSQGEMVGIWGDFDADGVTATAVLWEGLGQFFAPNTQLVYFIPNRFTESHGLSHTGLDRLQAQGCRVIVTCDTGSTNVEELAYAASLGLDVIVTDHHTLLPDRPPVVALINPRSLPADHPLATLSGVAVAYKLVEALYAALPTVPQQPLTALLDLVAIGLIADLVELKGDCRYLAQRGIQQLQKQGDRATATRPGVAKLLEYCKRTGDRPTDISFGLGPRINAVSRIQGDAHFCVELLTSRDQQVCRRLAEATELANTRRKALQKDVVQQVTAKLNQLDLSTTSVIVLADVQWPLGVLGLVAGQIAQEYGRPTLLLSLPLPDEPTPLARGSARSPNGIDLYELLHTQAHLLHRFGGHPLAAGLSLPVENIPLLTDALNQHLRQLSGSIEAIAPTLQADLTVTVSDLGKPLFQSLKALEPCGMGNPVPRLLLQNVRFTNVWHRKLKDRQGHKIEYIKTEFKLWDDSAQHGFPGTWWGHYANEIPSGPCDAIAELDFNAHSREYEVRLIALRAQTPAFFPHTPSALPDWLWDWRQTPTIPVGTESTLTPIVMQQCPATWVEWRTWLQRAEATGRPLAIAYPPPTFPDPIALWTQLVGLAKYLSRTQRPAPRQQLLDKLGIGDRPLQAGFQALNSLGFRLTATEAGITIQAPTPSDTPISESAAIAIQRFLLLIKEEQFQRQYFAQLPLAAVYAIAQPRLPANSPPNDCANLPN